MIGLFHLSLIDGCRFKVWDITMLRTGEEEFEQISFSFAQPVQKSARAKRAIPVKWRRTGQVANSNH